MSHGIRFALLTCLACAAFQGCASRPSSRGESIAPRDNTPRQVTVLGDDLSPLRDAFNDAGDQWRVVALVSPTCSECVLGAEAVQEEITHRYPQRDVAALIVWIPMLASDNENAARASATIFPPQRAAQFYDAHQTLGTRYARQTFSGFYERARKSVPDDHWLATALDDRIEVKRPQWDLYMLYAPGSAWDQGSDAPPMPTHWIRHLGRKKDGKTSIYWQDSPDSGPREGDFHEAIFQMAAQAMDKPTPPMKSTMKIEVLGFPGCPNILTTRANVQKAVNTLHLAADVVYVDQEKLAEDDSRRSWASPTVLVNGRELFGLPAPEGKAMGCRVYANGAPTDAEIVAALRSMIR